MQMLKLENLQKGSSIHPSLIVVVVEHIETTFNQYHNITFTDKQKSIHTVHDYIM